MDYPKAEMESMKIVMEYVANELEAYWTKGERVEISWLIIQLRRCLAGSVYEPLPDKKMKMIGRKLSD